MPNSTTLASVKVTLRVPADVTAFDGEISDLIDACLIDLGIAGVSNTDPTDKYVLTAIRTYCKANFGSPDPNEHDRLMYSYNQQKASMGMNSGYTEWNNG